MKKFFTLSIFLVAIVAFQFVGTHKAVSYTAGAPAGRTGSPGDNNRTCAQSGCHTGSASGGSVSINTNIPSSGYVPGQQYNIDVSVMQNGRSKFGFSITSEDNNHDNVGTFIGTSNVQTVSASRYASHRSGSTAGSDSKTWMFSWTAPSSGTGNVTFYAAGNATNNNNNASGDAIYTTSISVSEDLASGISTLNDAGISLYPVPATNEIWLEGLPNRSPLELKIFDTKGRLVWSDKRIQSANDRQKLNLSSIKSGIYILTLSLDGKLSQQKLVISR